jgi:hypothetical protein
MARIYYQLTTGHALIGPHLERIKKSDDDTCEWCHRVIQSREHLFENGQHRTTGKNELRRAVQQASGRGKMTTSRGSRWRSTVQRATNSIFALTGNETQVPRKECGGG